MTSDVLTSEGFAAALRAQLEQEITIYPARAWYPSSVGHPCDRFLVWSFTRANEKARYDWVLQSIFDEGNLHAPAMYARLEKMGFEVVRESDRPRQYKMRYGAVISGRVDGRLIGYRGQRFDRPRVLELKSCQQHVFDRLDTIEDVKRADAHYIRGYFDQCNLYCLLEELAQGVIVLKSKATGLLKLIPFDLDYEAAEGLLQRVERLQPMVDRGADPAPIPYDDGVCGRCAFKALCYPPRDYGQGVAVIEERIADLGITLDDFLGGLQTEIESKPAAAQHEKAKQINRKRLKMLGEFDEALCGGYLIQRTTRHVKGYTVAERDDVMFKIEELEPELKRLAVLKVEPGKEG